MKKLTTLIILFFMAISIPLVYLVLRTYRSLGQEEVAELRYFAAAIFDQMEDDMGSLVVREEARAIDEYNYNRFARNRPGAGPYSRFPQEPFILGYLQNNPDGSFQTPLASAGGSGAPDKAGLIKQLKVANEAFNRKRALLPEGPEASPPRLVVKNEKIRTVQFAEKYLRQARERKTKMQLRHPKRRLENISADQVMNIAPAEQKEAITQMLEKRRQSSSRDILSEIINQTVKPPELSEEYPFAEIYPSTAFREFWSDLLQKNDELQVAVDPIQSVFLTDDYVFVFRRIVLNSQTYCQGVVVKVQELLRHLAKDHFDGEPMTAFAGLELQARDQQREVAVLRSGVAAANPAFVLKRSFPSPFNFLSARIACDDIPRSPGRRTLNFVMFILAAVILMGLAGIYTSARALVDLSERRSGFVSSVTHELKTPLSTIRMYIEMLEQGIARDQEREQEYFRILGSESTRLGRLINNVLEFSKLEKKQRRFSLQAGSLEEVLQELQDIMQEKLRQEGFRLCVEAEGAGLFSYDREALLQVLINLVENSMKFGKDADEKTITLGVRREGRQAVISVSDTGPGIPRQALKKVFDNFYRVDNDLTRKTSGTGIGLALVKTLVAGMGGKVTAANNSGPGCTITICLPAA